MSDDGIMTVEVAIEPKPGYDRAQTLQEAREALAKMGEAPFGYDADGNPIPYTITLMGADEVDESWSLVWRDES